METRGRTNRHDYSPLIEKLLSPWDVWRCKKDQLRSRCCFHKGDNPTAFSIFNNGKFRCYKCGVWGDIVKLVMHTSGMTLKQAQDYVGTAPIPFTELASIPRLPPWEDRASGVNYKVIREAILGPYRNNCPNYLLERGFSLDSLKHYEVGYDLQHAKIVLPVRDVNRKLVGLTYRLDFDSDKSQPAKYWHDSFEKSRHLYGFYHYVGKELKYLFIVEGQLDAQRMYQLGLAAVAIMGDRISDAQIQLLQRHCRARQVVLAFDNDEAGQLANAFAKVLLSRTRFGQELGYLFYEGKDPGELNECSKYSVRPIAEKQLCAPLELRPKMLGSTTLLKRAHY